MAVKGATHKQLCFLLDTDNGAYAWDTAQRGKALDEWREHRPSLYEGKQNVLKLLPAF